MKIEKTKKTELTVKTMWKLCRYIITTLLQHRQHPPATHALSRLGLRSTAVSVSSDIIAANGTNGLNAPSMEVCIECPKPCGGDSIPLPGQEMTLSKSVLRTV